MNFLNNKWISFVCTCVNFVFMVRAFDSGNFLLALVCAGFMIFCGRNFWLRMGEE